MEILSVEDYREPARTVIAPPAWDYVDGGSGDERTLAASASAFDDYRLRPRMLVDVSRVDTGTTLFGDAVATPVGVAPTAYHRLAHPDGEVATAAGAGAAGAPYVVSMFASRTLEDVAAAATGPLWMQVYWLRRRDVLADVVRRARDAGCRALVLTVDAPRIGARRRDRRNAFTLPPDVRAVNVDADVMAASHDPHAHTSGVERQAAEQFDASITWTDLAWLRETAGLPLLVKGLLSAEDAVLAVEHGADGVIVSNHGGRQLDAAVLGLHVLPDVVDAVAGRCPVLLDGGVRRGTDVFAALALGATAVLVGRPVLWGLAVDGAAGVTAVLDVLRDELEHAMALSGRPRLADVGRSAVVRWS